jgi:hypothetical protein
MICKTNFWYKNAGFGAEISDEEASFDLHTYFPFSEIMSRKRKVQFIEKDSYDTFISETMDNHLSKSKLFNPEVSVFVSREKMNKMFEDLDRNNENSFINNHKTIEDLYEFSADMFVESDGKRAIFKRIR